MEMVLLLSRSYEPISIIRWQKAISMLFLNKVEVIEEYNSYVHSTSITLKIPSVVRLLNYFKRPYRRVKFNKANVLIRDGWKCCYCGKGLSNKDFTYDHVIPRSRGGRTDFENVVSCCVECNTKKGDYLPHEVGFNLRKRPVRPDWTMMFSAILSRKNIPSEWKNFRFR